MVYGLYRTCFGVYWVLQVEGNVDDGPNHLVSVPLGGILKTLLYYVRCELVLREVQ